MSNLLNAFELLDTLTNESLGMQHQTILAADDAAEADVTRKHLISIPG